MNWKAIHRSFRDWMTDRVWRSARPLIRHLRTNRTEMRVFMLCHFTVKGPAALHRLDVPEILLIRSICGPVWFDRQLLWCDDGHEICDPFRTVIR